MTVMEEAYRRFTMMSAFIREAGDILMQDFRAGHNAVSSKGENDFVTTADKANEERIRSFISLNFPSDSVLGEEEGESSGSDGFRWIVDPIDGTVNFMNGFPLFSISIALEYREELVAGLVYIPYYDELFSAFKDKGAYLNDKPIHVTAEQDLSRTLMLAVPPHRVHAWLDSYLSEMRQMYNLCSDIRSVGSAAVSLCYTACGRCSAYYERFLHIYDIAAGLVIVKEAGGAYSLKESGHDTLDVLAGSPLAESRLKEVLEWQ